MKKIALVLTFPAFLLSAKAQTICDSLTVDTVYVDANSFNITVYNSSEHFIVYPFFSVLLDANPYISFNNNLTVPSYLSTANDANIGFTGGNYFDINLTPAAQVPQNTLFTGMLMIQDPNDSTFLCSLPFSFLYGEQLASLNELSSNKVSLYPNPSNGTVEINCGSENATISVVDQTGRTVQQLELNNGKGLLHIERNGVYFLQITTTNGQFVEKLLIQSDL